MTEKAWQTTDIMGLTPAIDARRADKIFALGGQNFAFTSQGPRSLFGNQFLLPQALGLANHVQGIRFRLRSGDRAFTFVGDAILEWDEDVGGWLILYITPVSNIDPYRWTAAYLNDHIYFCHPRVGVIVYDLDTEVISKHEAPGVPLSPIALTVNAGRLGILDDEYFTWSWQADGLNFTPALNEAGAQGISDRVAGSPIMVTNYAQGVIIWTTGGMLRSEFTGDAKVYRHRNLNTEYRPVNSFCVFQSDENKSVILDERGLFESDGGPPTPYAPLFNEFLINYIRENDLSMEQQLRLEWDDLRRFLYVMISVTPQSPLYEKAFVLYPSLDKWGVFNEQTYGILPIRIDTSVRAGSYFGFVDSEARVRIWDDLPSRQLMPDTNSEQMNLRYPRIQKPTQQEEDGSAYVGSSSAIFNSEAQQDFLGSAGYYANDSNNLATLDVTGLDASLQIGLIRAPQFTDSHDRLTEVNHIMIANVESGEANQLAEDYLVVPDGTDDEDYESETGSEDFGLNPVTYINHGLRLVGTVDGQSVFQEEVPVLVEFTQAARYYSCSVEGIWHILELTADNAGELFHPRLFEMNHVDAGRLS